jgi:hypothetical protein
MSMLWSVRMAMISAVALSALVVPAAPASADPPSPGDPCPVLNDTALDVDGQTMWCNPTNKTDPASVWMYGGPKGEKGDKWPFGTCDVVGATRLNADGQMLWCNPVRGGPDEPSAAWMTSPRS